MAAQHYAAPLTENRESVTYGQDAFCFEGLHLANHVARPSAAAGPAVDHRHRLGPLHDLLFCMAITHE